MRPGGVLVACLAGAWSARLTCLPLPARLAPNPRTAATRSLREELGRALRRASMFWFFQAQAVLAVLLSLPFLFAVLATRAEVARLAIAGSSAPSCWLGHLGRRARALADASSTRWRSEPCEQGPHVPLRRAVGLLAPSQLLLRVGHWLVLSGARRSDCPWGWIALARARRDALLRPQGHRHPADRGAVAPEPGRRLPRVPGRRTNAFFPGPNKACRRSTSRRPHEEPPSSSSSVATSPTPPAPRHPPPPGRAPARAAGPGTRGSRPLGDWIATHARLERAIAPVNPRRPTSSTTRCPRASSSACWASA